MAGTLDIQTCRVSKQSNGGTSFALDDVISRASTFLLGLDE
jgi:hypothetical protein